ncbi:MFS transporter [Allorhizocola rhizosphaerae]|uniref:MFS transporter n=1 Tax=Allorhizocola rhizosphaerae TaxID=1872709 RepID=UPI0013C3127E|nr:MFS transporter [Allorhizocola rhizosphaerae]
MIWSSLKQLPTWVRLLVLGRFINAAGALAWFYLTVYLVQERGMAPVEAGVIVGANGAGLIAGNLLGGWLGDRFGIKRVLLIGYAGWAVTCSLMPLAPNAFLLALSALAGLSAGSGHPLGVALVADAVPPEQRRMGIAISRAAMNAGIMVGPPLGALAAGVDFSLVFVIDAVTSLALMFIVWRFVPKAQPKSRDDIPSGFFRAVRADRRVLALVIGVVALDTSYRQIFTGLPLMLTDDQTPLIGYGALISISCLIIVLAETPLAIYLAKRPALKVISSGWALVGLGFVVLAVWPRYGGAVLAILIITVGEMLYKPTSPAFAADRAPSGMSGRFQSLYSGASISGMVLSPPLGGFVYQYAPGLLWPMCAGLALLAAVMLVNLD